MRMCTYCGKYFDNNEMTPLYEKDKNHIKYYCSRCIGDVKGNLYSYGKTIGYIGIPDFYKFGKKGETPDSDE